MADRASASPPDPEGAVSVRNAASQIESVLNDDGHFNPNPDQLSRGHPDYVEGEDNRVSREQSRDRDTGQFKKAGATDITDDGEPGSEDDTSLSDALEALDDPKPEDDDAQEIAADTDDGEGDETRSDGNEETDSDNEAGTDEAIETFTQLAEALEVSEENLANTLTMTFKAAGEDQTVTLADLTKGFQRDADYRRSTQKLAEDRRTQETTFTQRNQEYEQQATIAAHGLQFAEQMIASELQNPELVAMQTEDPAAFLLREREIHTRIAQLRQFVQQAANGYKEFDNKRRNDTRASELTALTEAVPDWGDSHKTQAKDVMSSLGFTAEEIPHIVDSRLIRGALELAQAREKIAALESRIAKAKDAVKRVKKDVPKFTAKPGKATSAKLTRKSAGQEKARKLAKRFNTTHHVNDAAALIENML